jgi:hypothetical protein
MANYGHIIHVTGLLAGADLSAKQYKPVKLASTAGEVVAATAVTDMAIGILQNDPADGEVASIAGVGSVSLVVAGTSVLAAGDFCTCNTTGVTKTTTDNTAIVGRALTAAAASGDLITIQVLTGRY